MTRRTTGISDAETVRSIEQAIARARADGDDAPLPDEAEYDRAALALVMKAQREGTLDQLIARGEQLLYCMTVVEEREARRTVRGEEE